MPFMDMLVSSALLWWAGVGNDRSSILSVSWVLRVLDKI